MQRKPCSLPLIIVIRPDSADSINQYKVQFRKWGFSKNLNIKTKLAIEKAKQERREHHPAKKAKFMKDGRDIPSVQEKMERFRAEYRGDLQRDTATAGKDLRCYSKGTRLKPNSRFIWHSADHSFVHWSYVPDPRPLSLSPLLFNSLHPLPNNWKARL